MCCWAWEAQGSWVKTGVWLWLVVRSWVQMISPGGHIWLLRVCVGKWFVIWDNFKVLWVSSRIGSFILWTQIECKSWMLSASNRLLGIGVGCNDQKKNRALHEEKTLFCLLRFVIHMTRSWSLPQVGLNQPQNSNRYKKVEKSKRTTPGIPTWSPTVVLTWPDSA